MRLPFLNKLTIGFNAASLDTYPIYRTFTDSPKPKTVCIKCLSIVLGREVHVTAVGGGYGAGNNSRDRQPFLLILPPNCK